MAALEGIRVLDLTQVQAGPLCTMLLAGLGAEVIKVERPGGELGRRYPPTREDMNPYIAFLGRGKKGVTLNLKDTEGVEILKRLAAVSDVLVENYSPGTMEGLGLGYEVLREVNPGLIYASISGFGQTGPWSGRRSFDPIAQALSGFMWLGKEMVDPEGPPRQAPEAVGDTIPGILAAYGILAALISRGRTGAGQWIDVSQMESLVSVSPSFAYWVLEGTTLLRSLAAYNLPCSGYHRARDGHVMFFIPQGRLAEWFRETTGLSGEDREEVAGWVAERTVEEVVRVMDEAGVPAAPVYTVEDVLGNEHSRARGLFVEVDSPLYGKARLPGFPFKLSETDGDLSTPAPRVGEHNREIYGDLLGLSEGDFKRLTERGTI
ncbi:MAG TPA: CoA transferase [Candidatus Desulfaltia sp.]|nr:CoA transferase [Candidatus Desulfaltia sp.]